MKWWNAAAMVRDAESMSEKRILFVDDEPPILKTLTVVFRALGYKPFSTTNGHEAIEMVALEQISVCFLDLRMPERNWRTGRSMLAAWEAEIAKRPSLAKTVPVE